MAIGQGALIVTPLQLARAIGGMAVGGKWYQPHMVKKAAGSGQGDRVDAQSGAREDVMDGMYGVVNEGGTGMRAALPHIEVCGKTGTAQLASNDFLKARRPGKDMKDNAWFVGFAPRDNPEIVVVALFEHGEHGQFAAAIVRDVIKAYFDKKERLTQLQQDRTSRRRLGLGVRPGRPGASYRPSRSSGATGRRPGHRMTCKYLSPRDIDWTVLLIVLLICGVGVLQIYSATRDTDYTSAWWKQIVYVAGGLFLMWLVMAVDYHSMLHYVPALVYRQRGGAAGHLRHRGEGIRLQTLDSGGLWRSLAGIGIRQAGDNIVGSSLSHRIANR